MTDLDTELRTMLQNRARDIQEVPPGLDLLDPAGGTHRLATHATLGRPRPRPRRATWLIAASVAGVLVIAALIVVFGRNAGDRSAPAVTNDPSPSVTPSPSPSVSPTETRIQSRVSLTWFGMAALPGYTFHGRESEPGYEWLAVRSNSDAGTPIGCNGCESASDYIYVFDKGKFDASKNGPKSTHAVTVDGKPGVAGTAELYGVRGYHVPSVAWQYSPDKWVLVQGVTPLGDTALLTVANAVRPAQSTPIGLPATFRHLPPLPIVDITDDRSEGYAFTLTMGDDLHGRSFSLQLWNGTGWPYYDRTGMNRTTIDGLPGYVGSAQGVGVLYHGGGMAFAFNESGDPPASAAADQAEMQHVIAGLRWANGDGRPPLVPLPQALHATPPTNR